MTENGEAFYQQSAKAIALYLWQELQLVPNRHYRIRMAVSGPRVLTLAILINPRYMSKLKGLAEPLSMVVGLDRGQTIRVERGQAGSLALEIPKPKSLWYNVPITALPRRRGVRTTIGLDTEHRPAWVDFTEPTGPHCLVAGATGSGKTNAQRLLFYDLAVQNGPEEVVLLLMDTSPKQGLGWRALAGLPHLIHPVITDNEEAHRALAWATAEIRRRGESGQDRPRIFIGIDELQELLVEEGVVNAVAGLAAVGREVGIHLIAATQNPTAEVLKDVSIKRNMFRLVGRVDSPDAARAAAGMGGTGAERLTGAGDMILVKNGQLRRVTTALLTERDFKRLPSGNGQQRWLDLSAFEDLRYVTEAVNPNGLPGRNPDPIEPEHVYRALVEPDISQNELYRLYGIGRPKARAVKAMAGTILDCMDRDGWQICRQEDAQDASGIRLVA